MHRECVESITPLLALLPSRRDILRGLAGTGGALAALLGWPRGSDIAAKTKRKKKQKKKPSPPRAQPPPLPFNQFGCLDVGQPCQGDSTLCCSGVCQGVCVAHNSDVCFPDTDSCISGQGIRCHPQKAGCICFLTTGNAGFCADFNAFSHVDQMCRFCSTDTDCQEEFGPGSACVVLKGPCSALCAATGRTACLTPCA